MSALPARAATAGSLALALALGLPAAAFADPGEEDRDRKGSQSQGEERSGERNRSATAPHGEGDEGQRKAARKEKEQERGTSTDRSSSHGSADEGRAGGDPRGNNGTVKIDGMPFDDGRGNEPHVGCTFQVDFYGFDAGDTASITFTGHAPTGGGLLHSETATPISNDAAGGGQDRDATLTYSVSNELSELLSIAPHPQQGWHVKLAVDVDSAPGGAKQKVFWIDCPQAPATGSGSGTTQDSAGSGTGTTGGAGSGTGTTTSTVSAQGAGTATVLPATVVSGTTVAAAERQEALALGSGTTTLAGGQTSAAQGSAAGQTDVAARGAVSPSALPFTGSQALLYLLGLGLSAVGVGAIAHRMGRQQADLS